MSFSKTVTVTLNDDSLATINEICLVFGQTYEWWAKVLKQSDLVTVGTKGHRKYKVGAVLDLYDRITREDPVRAKYAATEDTDE